MAAAPKALFLDVVRQLYRWALMPNEETTMSQGMFESFGGGDQTTIRALKAEIERLRAVMLEAASCLERGAYDLRDGGYLRSATILEECSADIRKALV